jgi:hypothetical protein
VDRVAARRIAFALLTAVALAATAATIDSTVTGGGIGGTGGAAGGAPSGAPAPVISVGPEAETLEIEPICVPTLARPPVVAALVFLFFAGQYAVYRRTGSLRSVVATALAVGFPATVLWGFLVACRSGFRLRGIIFGGSEGVSLPAGGGGFGMGAGGGGPLTAPIVLFGLLLAAAIAAALVLFVVSVGDRDSDGTEADSGESAATETDVHGVGRTAGAAADRIESDADVDNEVYRAWAEMASSLDVERPESSTPGEFAAAAVDAGMDRADVDELTRLFEEVRYGDERATGARAERAVAALRRIESAYAGEEP